MAGRVGVVIDAFNAAEAVERIRTAEAMDIPHAWMTTGGPSPDALTIFAGAATVTERITMSSCIVPTWLRHPLVLAQQSVALESLAPGRFRLGIGPCNKLGSFTRSSHGASALNSRSAQPRQKGHSPPTPSDQYRQPLASASRSRIVPPQLEQQRASLVSTSEV